MIAGLRTPVVMLAVEGGPNTVKTIMKAVKNKIPVVIIKSSGRAADIICKVLDRVKAISVLVARYEPTNQSESQSVSQSSNLRSRLNGILVMRKLK